MKNNNHTTHHVCNEIMEKCGGKAQCCECTGHECMLEDDKLIADDKALSDMAEMDKAQKRREVIMKVALTIFVITLVVCGKIISDIIMSV